MPGANEFTAEEIEALFNGEGEQETPPAENNNAEQPVETTEKDVSQTKAFAKRLSEEKAKERDNIAKELGYDSYSDLKAKREKEMLEAKGIDPELAAPIVDELVKKKIDEDPRMKELEKYRAEQVKEFAKRELEEITKLTNGEITDIKQLPKDVLDLWKTKGSLKAAFIELKGEELILKSRGEQSKGSTDHLANPSGSSNSNSKVRPLTKEEKYWWKAMYPEMSQEELDKKTIPVEN